MFCILCTYVCIRNYFLVSQNLWCFTIKGIRSSNWWPGFPKMFPGFLKLFPSFLKLFLVSRNCFSISRKCFPVSQNCFLVSKKCVLVSWKCFLVFCKTQETFSRHRQWPISWISGNFWVEIPHSDIMVSPKYALELISIKKIETMVCLQAMICVFALFYTQVNVQKFSNRVKTKKAYLILQSRGY